MKDVLLYKSSAVCFEEALPIGNGSLGAMVYGGVYEDKLSINHDTLWSGSPRRTVMPIAYEANEKARGYILEGKIKEAETLIAEEFNANRSQKYVPMGDLHIYSKTVEEAEGYKRTLNMKNAVVNAEFKGHKREYFCSNPDDVLAIKYHDEKPQCYRLSFDSPIKCGVSYRDGEIVMEGECPSALMPYVLPDEPCPYNGLGVKFTAVARVISDGTVYEKNDGLYIDNACETYIYICVKTSYIDYNTLPTAETKEACAEKIKKVVLSDYEEIKKRHMKDFSKYYTRTELTLSENDDTPTDEILKSKSNYPYMAENIFSYAKYLMISSSRPGSEAMNLQGIWNDMLYAPWNSNYTLNINTEMNYWPAMSFDLFEMTEPYIRLAEKLADTGTTTARGYYNARGAVSHAVTDLWGMSTSSGRMSLKSCSYSYWNMSFVWIVNELYSIFEHAGDTSFLKERIYPLMKKAVDFCSDCLVELNEKKVILMSTSPENRYISDGEDFGVSKYTAMTQELVTALFKNYLKCCKVLKIDADDAEKTERTIPELYTFEVGSRGQLLEWDSEFEEKDIHHRHVSHLWGIYPGILFTEKSDKDMYDASKRSLEIRGDDGTGWSIAWKMNLWARFKEANHSYDVFKKFMTFSQPVDHDFYKNGALAAGVTGGVFPNLFDAHPPFQIDGNFGAAMAIIQWFVQYEDGVIKILPSLPDELGFGEIKGIKINGNIKLDIKWENNRCTEFKAISPISQKAVFAVNEKEISVCLKENAYFSYRAD